MGWLKLFTTPSAKTLAQRELEDAERELLRARSAAEYAQSMVEYNTQRVARLRVMLNCTTPTNRNHQ